MGACKRPGPICVTNSAPIDSGTLSQWRSQPPRPVGSYPTQAITPTSVVRASAAYNRTFLSHNPNPNPYATGLLAVDPDSAMELVWIDACETDDKGLKFTPTWMLKDFDRDFAAYATKFEQECTPLAGKQPESGAPSQVVPVVLRSPGPRGFRYDELLVVGYRVTVRGDSIFAPKGALRVAKAGPLSEEQLKQGVPLFVANDPSAHRWGEPEKGPLLWDRAGLSELRYTVLTRVDGRVMRILGCESTGFVESEFGPLLFIGTALAPLGRGLFSRMVTSLFRRESGALALNGMTDEVAQSVAISSKTIVEIGAGDLRASIQLAKSGARVIAVDPMPAAPGLVAELESLGGTFVKGTAESVPAGSADQVVQYFPWRVSGTGSHVSGGTWRVVGDAAKLLKPGGTATFVTEDLETAEYLAKQGTSMGMKAELTNTTAAAAAPGASGSGVPNFSGALKVYAVKLSK